jgi:N-acetylmuramoyl-L-alanine amidase
VIDPGHGGIEHGAVGASGVLEDNLNLQISLILKEKLMQAGVKVVMTRETADVDYSGDDTTRKHRDMYNRAKLIIDSKPNAIICINMNKNSIKNTTAHRHITGWTTSKAENWQVSYKTS